MNRFAKIEGQFNISINLFSHSNSDIYPIRITRSTAEKHVDLLVTSNSETNHYVWIKTLISYVQNHNKPREKHFCKLCIQHFSSETILQKYMEDCIVLTKCQAIEMPAEGTVTKFKSFRETVKIPFVIYADMESILEKLTVSQEQTSDMQDSDTSESQEQEKLKTTKTFCLLLWLQSCMLL